MHNVKQTNFLLNLVGYYYYDICLTAFFQDDLGKPAPKR